MNPDHYTQETVDKFVEEYLEACSYRHADADGYPVAYCVSKAVINAYTRLLAKRVVVSHTDTTMCGSLNF
jgi:NAD(P)-dependent dehydrogenase (short-subunit alcohol dehydrogenase family)